MSSLPLAFTAPFVLLALATLPVIWLLLRVTPPHPKRIAFPPLRLFFELSSQKQRSAHTPWWLLLIRLLTVFFIILACAGPLLNPPPKLIGNGPILLLIDNDLSSAQDWEKRFRSVEELAMEAFRNDRSLVFVALAEEAAPLEIMRPEATLSALRNVRPMPHLARRTSHIEVIRSFLKTHPDTSIIWLSGSVDGLDGEAFVQQLGALSSQQAISVIRESRSNAAALTPSKATNGEFAVRVIRMGASTVSRGLVRARDVKGRTIAETAFTLTPDSLETKVSFDIPTEMRNTVSRIEIVGERSAGAVVLMDERNKRRSIGIASGTVFDQSQPFVSPAYYLQRALQPYADIHLEQNGDTSTISSLIDRQVNVIILADTGILDGETTKKLSNYIERGGILLRFAGNRLAGTGDPLLPVRLRQAERNLGSVLSWSSPRKLASFSKESPFYGLHIADDIVINRQVLAEPDIDLSDRIWATLEDGTPLVTAKQFGRGKIILFHVSATPSWSSLPISGLFVEMLRRITQFGPSSISDPVTSGEQPLQPRLVLNGFGEFTPPPAKAHAISSSFNGRATLINPPGFYGPVEGSVAISSLSAGDVLKPLNISALPAEILDLTEAGTIDLRKPLFVLSVLLFLLDTIAMLFLSGRLSARNILKHGRRVTIVLLAISYLGMIGTSSSAQVPSSSSSGLEPASLETRLAYVITGDREIDLASEAGLLGLGQFVTNNTSFEPGAPVGIDLEKDELAFYPLIYWPISPSQPFPNDKVIRHLNTFMKNGGTILFDSRDAMHGQNGMVETPEALYLRRLLTSLDVPKLKPVQSNHVLTKTFFLLNSFPGRYDRSPLWTEDTEIQGDEDDGGLVNTADGVSPILVTGNDFAAAWAIGARNETLYPVTGADPRQREMAFRSGANIVLYTLTGNYKADQVHVQDILKRLGQQESK